MSATAQKAPVETIVRKAVVIGLPVGKPNPDTASANATAYAQKGEALAERILHEVGQQAIKGVRFLRAIFDLTPEGRKAMRATLARYLVEVREERRQAAGTPIETLLASKAASMAAQVSGYSRFSTACDAGFEPADWEVGFHALLAEARAFLNSGAALRDGKDGDEVAFAPTDAEGNPIKATGPTRLRGRQPLTKAEKFVRYVEKLEPMLSDLEDFVSILKRSIKATKDEAAAEALKDREGEDHPEPQHEKMAEESDPER